jgi:hypothetical protein
MNDRDHSPSGPEGGRPVPERETVFYYNRERRLEKAPPAVQALYTAAPPRGGLIRPLVATKGNRIIFTSIVIMLGLILVYSFFLAPNGNRAELGGNRISATAFRYPGDGEKAGVSYIALRKEAQHERAYTGSVELAVSIPGASLEAGDEPPIAVNQVFFSLESPEEFRFSVPFEAAELIILIQAGEEMRSLRIRPE